MIKSMFEHTPVLIGLLGVVGSLYACAFRRVRRERRARRQEEGQMPEAAGAADGDRRGPPTEEK